MGQVCCGPKSDDQKIRDLLAGRSEVVRIMLLGAGESGKTTVMKQLSLLYGSGFDDAYKRQQRKYALSNLIEGTYLLVEQGSKTPEYRIEDPAAREAAVKIRTFYFEHHTGGDFGVTELNDEIVDSIRVLLHDDKFKLTVTASSKYMLPDGWKYFKDKILSYPAWGGKNWTPNDEDVLHVRARTTGINRQMLLYKSPEASLELKMEVVDVGGQLAERAKWKNIFAGINSILFLQSMSDYDQVMFENEQTNRLEDSLDLWCKHVSKSDFHETAFMLFLNKDDLMVEKFIDSRTPIEPKFGDVNYLRNLAKNASGLDFQMSTLEPPPLPPVNNPTPEQRKVIKEEVNHWFIALMMSLVPEHKKKDVFAHITTAVARSTMEAIFAISLANLFQKALNFGGFTQP